MFSLPPSTFRLGFQGEPSPTGLLPTETREPEDWGAGCAEPPRTSKETPKGPPRPRKAPSNPCTKASRGSVPASFRPWPPPPSKSSIKTTSSPHRPMPRSATGRAPGATGRAPGPAPTTRTRSLGRGRAPSRSGSAAFHGGASPPTPPGAREIPSSPRPCPPNCRPRCF